MNPGVAPTMAGVATARTIRVLLVDDQAIIGESVRRMLANEPGIEFHYCSDPTRAIPMANELRPTVILQDLVMPEVDGLLLVKFYRANPATRDTPMVVLSSKEEPTTKAKAFALGANDYLVKLPDRLELVARVRYHSQAYLNLQERNEAFRRLAESQEELAAELHRAAIYVQSLLPAPLTGAVSIDWRFVPSASLGGDMFGYHWHDSENLILYLLDVSGHGVGSSLLAVSAANVIANRSLADTDFLDPAQVMSRLNDVFQMDRQDGKYFTIFYAVFHKPSRKLKYCNAAHPAALLYTGARVGQHELIQLESQNPMVGMLPPGMPFEGGEVTVGPFSRLLVYSDGAFEVPKHDDVMWTYEEFLDFLSLRVGEATLADDLHAHLRELRGVDTLTDDLSIMDVML
jgi:sigma-B regulation protein RsbU (phosphoserine phosphatase)